MCAKWMSSLENHFRKILHLIQNKKSTYNVHFFSTEMLYFGQDDVVQVVVGISRVIRAIINCRPRRYTKSLINKMTLFCLMLADPRSKLLLR